MEIESLKPWVEVVASLSALIVGLVTALWAYTKFVVERGLLPPAQFSVECSAAGTLGDATLLEITVHLKNLGTSTLIATDIRLDIRYLEKGQPLELSAKPELFGRVTFPNSVRNDLIRTAQLEGPPPSPRRKGSVDAQRAQHGARRGFSVMPYDSFVLPQVDQAYSFATAVPRSASHVLVWASFRYAQHPKPLQKGVLWVSRNLGLIQFTLEHAIEPHSTERIFELKS